METANFKLAEGRSFALLGGLGANMTVEMRAALVSARQTVRFLTHLCVGHCVHFQEILREQPFYNVRTYDLVRRMFFSIYYRGERPSRIKFGIY
jgi:hypothetical protein